MTLHRQEHWEQHQWCARSLPCTEFDPFRRRSSAASSDGYTRCYSITPESPTSAPLQSFLRVPIERNSSRSQQLPSPAPSPAPSSSIPASQRSLDTPVPVTVLPIFQSRVLSNSSIDPELLHHISDDEVNDVSQSVTAASGAKK